MGADKRPARSSKVRAMERVSLQQQSDDEDVEAEELLLSRRVSDRGLRRSSRSQQRRTITIDSEDDDHHPIHEEEDDDPDDVDHDPKSFAQYNAPVSVRQNTTDDSQQDDQLDAADEQPLDNVQHYLKEAQGSAAGGFVTKYGRQVRPVHHSPARTPPVRTRRSTTVAELPTRRESRMDRARRRTKNSADVQYRPEPASIRLRARVRQARPSYSLNEADEDFDDEEEELIMDGNEDSASTPMQGRSKGTRSRGFKEPRNGHRRVSTRKKSSTNQIETVELTYETKDAPMRAANGIGKGTRTSTRQSKYLTSVKDSAGEEDGDGDFLSPGTGEESDDHDLQDAGLPEDQDALHREPHGEDCLSELPPRRTRRASSRRTRKTQPQRIIRTKVKRGTKREADEENPIAREARKSYRPRNESLRPADYYAEAESSSEDSSTDREFGASTTRSRPKRAAASRAGDAIANKLDYLQNPTALEGSLPKRPRLKYERRKSGLRPAGKDPFPSDGDDGFGPTAAAGIEPIQVDLNLSWSDIGGLDHHVRALKEMVALPLLYPEIFEKFNMEAPKGVLFYGPPGTGKTLCARALAASCGADTEAAPTDGVENGALNANSTPGDTKTVPPAASVPDKAVSEMPRSVEKGTGEVKPEQPNPDVIMVEARTEEIKAIASNGPSTVEEKPKEEVNVAAEAGCGPETLAVEHETVITERATELHKGAALQDGSGTAPDSQGSPSKSPGSLDDKSRTKKKPRVSFFMRNGADCLSKWVGEAERQLRMTFEAARKHQPAIIFFDEIDGLAPVRSSRQDQIHSSIVSTLLGLMDGLDARGKIVVIGATNRVDAIDPALRRPGRFDRELIFALPNVQARRKILGIHTAKWSPPPNPDVLDTVASMTVGYCGADLKALCTESAIRALRRRYPQIYASKEKLLINVDEVKIKTRDFLAAMKEIVPASHRSARTHARPITTRLGEILNAPLESCIAVLKRIFPQGLGSKLTKKVEPAGPDKAGTSEEDNKNAIDDDSVCSSSDDDYDVPKLSEAQDNISNAGKMRPGAGKLESNEILRPRLLICGMQGLGQAQLGPAILHHCEGCPIHPIDYPSLHSDASARCAEEALVSAFHEATRSVPAILYLPHLDLWWESASPSLRTTLIIALKDLPSDLPLLVLATADTPLNALSTEVTELFGETVELSAPSEASRKRMFAPLLDEVQAIPRLSHVAAKRLRKKRRTEILPKAPPPKAKPPTEVEVKQKLHAEDKLIRRMRMEMRAFVESLLRDTRFKAFWNPVDPKSAPDYYDIIKIPMDISKIAAQVDLGRYPTVLAMVNDFDILVRNAIQYNPPNTATGAAILRRAHGLIDIVHAWVDNLNPALVETCNKIIGDRVARKQKEMAATQAAASERNFNGDLKEEGKDDEATAAQPTTGKTDEPGVGNQSNLEKVPSPEAELMSNGARMNGCAEGETMEVELVRNEEALQQPSEEEQEIATEAVTVASRSEVMALAKLLLDVSTGVTVDGLESLYVRCVKVLREERRCMNRDVVVKQLIQIATEARDDPVVVGTLVE